MVMTFEDWLDETDDNHDLYNFPVDAMKEAWEQATMLANRESAEIIQRLELEIKSLKARTYPVK